MYSSNRKAGPTARLLVALMDHVRYLLGVLAFIVHSPGLLFWFVIHPWARWWRKLGPPRTYLIVFSMLAAVGVLVFQVRGPLLGRDLGTSWRLTGAAPSSLQTLQHDPQNPRIGTSFDAHLRLRQVNVNRAQCGWWG
jgi:hypothetical protein